MNQETVGILLFNEVEVLDFAGPYEVFSRTRLNPGIQSRRSDESAPFRVFTVSATLNAVEATGGLRVLPDFDFATVPKIDILVVPGGFGTRGLLNDTPVLSWIAKVGAGAQLVTSVCTGSLLLAKAGFLSGKRATTHWGAVQLLAEVDPTIRVQSDQRVVKDGIYTSAGVSAGIDMALDVVESKHGKAVADDTAHYMDYPRHVG